MSYDAKPDIGRPVPRGRSKARSLDTYRGARRNKQFGRKAKGNTAPQEREELHRLYRIAAGSPAARGEA